MKKLDKDTALAKIKIKINKYFEDVGRDLGYDADEMRIQLIDDIDDILDNVEISQKHLILEKLEVKDEEP